MTSEDKTFLGMVAIGGAIVITLIICSTVEKLYGKPTEKLKAEASR